MFLSISGCSETLSGLSHLLEYFTSLHGCTCLPVKKYDRLSLWGYYWMDSFSRLRQGGSKVHELSWLSAGDSRSSYLQVQSCAVWSFQEFTVTKRCAQQTLVVTRRCVLMLGFIFYAHHPLNNVELAPEVSLSRHHRILTAPSV